MLILIKMVQRSSLYSICECSMIVSLMERDQSLLKVSWPKILLRGQTKTGPLLQRSWKINRALGVSPASHRIVDVSTETLRGEIGLQRSNLPLDVRG